jgi:hypothetical protein
MSGLGAKIDNLLRKENAVLVLRRLQLSAEALNFSLVYLILYRALQTRVLQL